MFPILLLMLAVPFLFLSITFFLEESYSHQVAILSSLVVLILSFFVVYQVNQSGAGSLSVSYQYIPALNVNLSLQVTNLTLILVVMTAIVFFSASLVGKYFIQSAPRMYNLIFLVGEGAALGVFLSANLFLFYLFWEISEIAMFFMIFIYGGYDRRYAAIKFIVYSLISSLLLLIGIMLLYFYTPVHTFDILAIENTAGTIPQSIQVLVMLLLLVAFLIKVPVFPFHSWLPDAHTEAPTTGSMILAGVLLKLGGYGLLLTFLLVPLTLKYGAYLAVLFGFSAVYGAFVALTQVHLKRMIAYTSIVDMGIVALGVAAANSTGTAGALYAMLSHGIAISLLFLIVGTVEKVYATLIISRIKGVITSFPALSYLFLFGTLATIGLPLTTGFVGDLLVFIGSFFAFGVNGLIPLIAILIVAAYLFWVIERSFFTTRQPSTPYTNVSNEVLYSAFSLVFFSILLGILPGVLLSVSGFV